MKRYSEVETEDYRSKLVGVLKPIAGKVAKRLKKRQEARTTTRTGKSTVYKSRRQTDIYTGVSD